MPIDAIPVRGPVTKRARRRSPEYDDTSSKGVRQIGEPDLKRRACDATEVGLRLDEMDRAMDLRVALFGRQG